MPTTTGSTCPPPSKGRSDIKLWIDEKREPDVDWVWTRTVAGTIAMLKGGCVDRISFAPDQRDLVSDVVDWMIDHEVHPARREIHPRSAKAKNPRMLKIRKQAS